MCKYRYVDVLHITIHLYLFKQRFKNKMQHFKAFPFDDDDSLEQITYMLLLLWDM